MNSIISPLIKSVSKTVTITSSANGHGYSTVTFDNANVREEQIVSVLFKSSRIAVNSGIQFTPVFYNSDTHILYFHYANFNAISDESFEVTIKYI